MTQRLEKRGEGRGSGEERETEKISILVLKWNDLNSNFSSLGLFSYSFHWKAFRDFFARCLWKIFV